MVDPGSQHWGQLPQDGVIYQKIGSTTKKTRVNYQKRSQLPATILTVSTLFTFLSHHQKNVQNHCPSTLTFNKKGNLVHFLRWDESENTFMKISWKLQQFQIEMQRHN